jgi:hypothetical protein
VYIAALLDWQPNLLLPLLPSFEDLYVTEISSVNYFCNILRRNQRRQRPAKR